MRKYSILLIIFFLKAVEMNAQICTFYTHEMDNTKYQIDINVKQKTINATNGNHNVFSCRYYDYTVNDEQTRIGLSLINGKNAVTDPVGSSHFIISRSKGMSIRLTNGTEYRMKSDYEYSHSEAYDQLKRALKPPLPFSSNHTFTVNGVSFTMIYVQDDTFNMGATNEQKNDAYSSEEEAHKVYLTSYMIGQTEVTQSLWNAVMGTNPSKFTGKGTLPVEQVSWEDCQLFIDVLNYTTGENFRLPTEAEWEFAARGGVKSKGYKYSGSNNIADVAWFGWYDNHAKGNSGGLTHPVASKNPNELGIYDMSGNVWEWCYDEPYDPALYVFNYNFFDSSETVINPQVKGMYDDDEYYICRGGSWNYDASHCRVSCRRFYKIDEKFNSLGLRLAL